MGSKPNVRARHKGIFVCKCFAFSFSLTLSLRKCMVSGGVSMDWETNVSSHYRGEEPVPPVAPCGTHRVAFSPLLAS